MIAYISLDEAIQKMNDLYRNDCIDYGASIPECFDNDRAIDALKELPVVDLDRNWKISGELEKGKVYIVTLNGSEQRDVDFCMWNGKEWGWAVDNVWNRNDDVIAWMEMPEPWSGGDSKDEREKIKWIINHLPSAQPENKELLAWQEDFQGYIKMLNLPRDDYKGIMEYINEVPPAQSRKGEWIYYDPNGFKCSRCGRYLEIECGDVKMNFCPHCGSYNGGEHNE